MGLKLSVLRCALTAYHRFLGRKRVTRYYWDSEKPKGIAVVNAHLSPPLAVGTVSNPSSASSTIFSARAPPEAHPFAAVITPYWPVSVPGGIALSIGATSPPVSVPSRHEKRGGTRYVLYMSCDRNRVVWQRRQLTGCGKTSPTRWFPSMQWLNRASKSDSCG